MAITYSLAPNPHWVIIDNFSNLPPGAAIYTYDSLNPSQFKPAFQDAGGTIPYGQPIVGFGNGTFPPIFWQFDSSNPTDLYYIQVWSQVQSPGSGAVMLWDFNGLTGSGSGGGGGTVTTNLDLENLVINGEFYRNVGNQVGSPSVGTKITLAPSNNAGLAGVGNNVNDGPPSPDIIFAKADTSASDSISFTNFTPGSITFAPNPTPQFYVNYTCTSGGTEAYKYVQFPIVRGLQNLNGINISVQMWNRYNSGNTGISLYLRQFFGNGTNGPSADVSTLIGALNLTAATWTKTQFNAVLVPSIAGKTIGNCGNDALFLQIRFPASVLINLDFILPAMYLGNTTSAIDFHTLDYVDSTIAIPRTGDIRTSVNNFTPYGWVAMNDGTIGSASSGATTRANLDTFPLYDLFWNALSSPSGNTICPVTGGLGASSIADFGANKALQLSLAAGRVLAGVSGSHALGTSGGADTHTNTVGEMAAHTHASLNGNFLGDAGSAFNLVGSGATSIFFNATTASNGSSTAWDVRQPTCYYNIFVKL